MNHRSSSKVQVCIGFHTRLNLLDLHIAEYSLHQSLMVTLQFLSSFAKQQLRIAQRLSQVSRPSFVATFFLLHLIFTASLPDGPGLTESKFKHDSYPPHINQDV
mmetsp:Transcript_15897/g.23256  ORF Transcript_15897/g.23256 Transcript_15897/m.23256 type:complete len:104 (+) Transcript_15897:1064-1375(+)